ncbi:unnamed protein product [Musa textilis]
MFNIQPRSSSLKSKRQETFLCMHASFLICILQKCSLVRIETDLVVLVDKLHLCSHPDQHFIGMDSRPLLFGTL